MLTHPADSATETIKELEPVPRQLREERTVPVKGPNAPPADNPRRRRGWGWLLLIVLAAAGWYYRALWLPWIPPALLGRGTSGAPAKSGPRTIPVRTAPVGQRNMDLYLNGLGTVTAFKTVTMRSRVDGELVNVAFNEGQIVREGDLLAEIDPRPFAAQLQQAEGQLARDQATLQLAKLTLARGQDLARSKSIAPQQVDEQVAQVEQMEGTIQTDEAMVANARLQLSYCRIVSPISGRIGLRLVDQGNIVHANDPNGLAVITQLQPIALVFTIPQDDIPRVQKQMHAGKTLAVEAWDRDFKTKLATGTLTAIDNQVDPLSGTLRLKATFENEDNMLFPNQFVNARLLVDVKQDAIVVPSAAVQRGPNGTFVYVVQPDETVKLRMITVGPSEGAETSIESGLTTGEIVVTDGIDKLTDGSKVSTREKEEKSSEKGAKSGGEGPKQEAGERDDGRKAR